MWESKLTVLTVFLHRWRDAWTLSLECPRSAGSLTDDSVRTAPLESNGGCSRCAFPKYGLPVPRMPNGNSLAAGRALKASKFVSAQSRDLQYGPQKFIGTQQAPTSAHLAIRQRLRAGSPFPFLQWPRSGGRSRGWRQEHRLMLSSTLPQYA
jgi:hypothetical protein